MAMYRLRAATLLELTIAMAIFTTVLAITVEALTSVRRFVNEAALDDSLADEASVVLTAITDDLANSAWLIDASTDVELLADSLEIDYDRDGARYYPYVIVQDYATATSADPTGLRIDKNGMPASGGWYDAFKRPPEELVTPARLLAAKPNLPPGHLGPSQSLIFMKVQRAPNSDNPDFLFSGYVNFDRDPAPMAAFSQPDRLPILNSLTLSEDGTQVMDMPLSWETAADTNAWDPTNNRFDSDLIRHYTYALVPDERFGSRLERRYRNRSGDPIEVHRVLSSSVDRIVIDTCRTTPVLGVNQVRVRVWLSRPAADNPLTPNTHYAETTIALRSTVDPEYSLRLDDWLGQAGKFEL